MTASVNAKELADRLGLSKARISQYVAQGKLAGCFTGEGRSRRFDLGKVAEALGQRLDLGQMMGNGSETKRAIKAAAIEDPVAPVISAPPLSAPAGTIPLRSLEPVIDRYEEARILNAEQDARRKTRDNERDEGRWILAEEVARESAKQLGKEVSKFETALRDGARDVADHFGIDFREVRQILMKQWRAHRNTRAAAVAEGAAAARMSETEHKADI